MISRASRALAGQPAPHFHCRQGVSAMQAKQRGSRKTAAPAATSAKTWSGRFGEPVAELVQRYNASEGFDQRLAPFDIQGSLALARRLGLLGGGVLGRVGLLELGPDLHDPGRQRRRALS